MSWLGTLLAVLWPAGASNLSNETPWAHPALAALPGQIIWGWERKEDLRWLPPEVGVAYVRMTIELESERYRTRPRFHPLLVNPGTVIVPVVHVDASVRHPPALNQPQHDVILKEVLKAAEASQSGVVQLDFEVRRSQREFYRDLVGSIRSRLPPDIALSVTALASWCVKDYWIGALPADEIVPMAFRMAGDSAEIRDYLTEKKRFTRPRCRSAIGISTDEPIEIHSTVRRYYFSPRSWKAGSMRVAAVNAH